MFEWKKLNEQRQIQTKPGLAFSWNYWRDMNLGFSNGTEGTVDIKLHCKTHFPSKKVPDVALFGVEINNMFIS